MTVDLKHLTYQQYLALPEMKARYSIITYVSHVSRPQTTVLTL